MTLFIDGTELSTADVPGSVSGNSPFGVHIGQRMDSRAFITGSIDDVHVWDRALSDEALAAREVSSKGTVLWLPMDHVSNSH